MILPTTVTGSYPRPLWFDRSLAGRSFKAALGDSLFREQYLDAVASIIAEQEARARHRDRRRQPLPISPWAASRVLLSHRTSGRHHGHRDTSRGGCLARPAAGKILWEVQEAYQPGVVRKKLRRGRWIHRAVESGAAPDDRPLKFGAICAPAPGLDAGGTSSMTTTRR